MKTSCIPSLYLACAVLAVSILPGWAIVSRGYSGTQIFSTYGGDKEEGEPNHCGEPGGASAWFFYQAPSDGLLVIDTEGSTFDTLLAVYIGTGTGFESLTSVDCNNDVNATSQWSRVEFVAIAGTMYFIAVDGMDGTSGTVNLNYAYVQPPVITELPVNQVVAAGGSIELTAAVVADVSSTYQWTYNGADVAGATNASLTLTEFGKQKDGQYKVKIRNGAGETESTEIALYEEGPPRVVSRSKPDKNSFKLRIAGSKHRIYVIQCSENLADWIDLITNSAPTGVLDYEDTVTADAAHRYYRALEQP